MACNYISNITLTKAAETQICRTLVQAAQATPINPTTLFRIYIVGGGCSGFEYGFKLDTHINSDDLVLEHHTSNDTIPVIKIIIDELSYQYLAGSEIDYVLSLQAAKYKINNPNAETTCGCGSSFSLKE